MRKIVLLLTLGAALFASALAGAKTKTVTYTGYEGSPPYTPLERVAFAVTGPRVTHVQFRTGFSCGPANPLIRFNTAVKFKIDKHKRFHGKVVVGRFHMNVSGSFSGKTLKGTISGTGRVGVFPCGSVSYGYMAARP